MAEAQAPVTEHLMASLERERDETAVALGFFLTLVVYRSFEIAFASSLHAVTLEELTATEQSMAAEEELRAKDGSEPIDWEEAVLHEQPGILGFVNEQIDSALSSDEGEIDVDDVHAVFRTIVLITIALSHAVEGHGVSRELLA